MSTEGSPTWVNPALLRLVLGEWMSMLCLAQFRSPHTTTGFRASSFLMKDEKAAPDCEDSARNELSGRALGL